MRKIFDQTPELNGLTAKLIPLRILKPTAHRKINTIAFWKYLFFAIRLIPEGGLKTFLQFSTRIRYNRDTSFLDSI
jgi:heme/copper-type cytochrome/quinol oxidase subunit 1